MRTGIEQDQLDAVWLNLKLDNDPEVVEMDKAFEKAMDEIKN